MEKAIFIQKKVSKNKIFLNEKTSPVSNKFCGRQFNLRGYKIKRRVGVISSDGRD